MTTVKCRGGSRGGGGAARRAPPLKLGKIWFFFLKSWFFTRNTPNIFAPPSPLADFFKCAPPPPNLKSWIRPWNGMQKIIKSSKSVPDKSNLLHIIEVWKQQKTVINLLSNGHFFQSGKAVKICRIFTGLKVTFYSM